MRLSSMTGERFKEKPADATIISQIFLMRGGYIKYVSNGIYSLLPPAKRIIAKIENIVREEMDAIGGQEVLMPVVLPRELWEESGRYSSVGSELLRFKDRGARDMLLAMTHEEAAVALVRDDANSYSRYPFMIYQIQTKFRDEPRCKGGLMRVREFTMKDAYSFHTDEKDLKDYYEKCKQAYFNIFRRIGIPEVTAVGSDTGMMGGSAAHEFMLLCDAGEDHIAVCPGCGYMDNVEVAETEIINTPSPVKERTLLATPGVTDIESLQSFTGISPEKMIKACVFTMTGGDVIVVFIRADYEVNETKLKKIIKNNVFPFDGEAGEESGLAMGYIGPVGLASKGTRVFYDLSLKGCTDMICGANKEGYHLSGVCEGRDFSAPEFYDIYKVKQGDKCLACGGSIDIKKGVEVGNIFQLGTKYTQSMNMSYLDENGKRQTPAMGCYGIGIGRSMASVAEVRCDDYGIIWPFAIAPWHIHICVLNGSPEMKSFAGELYQKLSGAHYEVIIDDRNASAGVQFSDADLLGVPYRVILGTKNFAAGMVEVASRDKSVKMTVEKDKLFDTLTAIISEEKSKL